MRIFIAALLPEDIRLNLNEYVAKLKPSFEGVKWERDEKLHVTLKFLGEVNEATVNDISEDLETLCRKHSPFKMEVARLGGFPDLEKPRVLYIGLSPNEELSALQSEIEEGLIPFGFEKEKHRFIPHVTIGRVKRRLGIQSAVPMAEKVEFEINKIGVIKSKLEPKGSVYTPLRVFEL